MAHTKKGAINTVHPICFVGVRKLNISLSLVPVGENSQEKHVSLVADQFLKVLADKIFI